MIARKLVGAYQLLGTTQFLHIQSWSQIYPYITYEAINRYYPKQDLNAV